MRRLLIGLVALMFVCAVVSVAWADTTGEAEWNRPSCISRHFNHVHDYECEQVDCPEIDERADPSIGVGLDLILWQNRRIDALMDKVTVEAKYDFRNEETSIYTVVTLNLSSIWQGE